MPVMRPRNWACDDGPTRMTKEGFRMHKLTAALVLGTRFAWAVVVSGLQTMRVILRSSAGVGAPAAAAFVRIRFAPIDARGATLLACMVTLTPGTTVIDIDMERREMLLHLLDDRRSG